MADAPRRLGVLIVSHDRGFLRLGAALLWRAGHSVHISGGSWDRVQRLLTLLSPQVVVLDVDDGLDAEIHASAGLTDREVEILRAVARGLSNKQISEELWVTEQTVKFHLKNIYRKLDVPNRAGAVRYAHQHGLGAS